MVKKIGIIGYSEGNGHPYSFSSIFNGFNEQEFDEEWSLIKNYLKAKPSSDFLKSLAKVEKVWTPSLKRSLSIKNSCNITHISESYKDMLDMDAIIIARDDNSSERKEILNFYLSKSIPCFCDKPLCTSSKDIEKYKPYLEKGLLYSGSGFRYAIEIDSHRKNIAKSKYICAQVVNDMEKYGIHILDAVLSCKKERIEKVESLKNNNFPLYRFHFRDSSLLDIICSKTFKKTFSINYLDSIKNEGLKNILLKDNFTAFRRILFTFINMLQTGSNSDSEVTLYSLDALSRIDSKNNRL